MSATAAVVCRCRRRARHRRRAITVPIHSVHQLEKVLVPKSNFPIRPSFPDMCKFQSASPVFVCEGFFFLFLTWLMSTRLWQEGARFRGEAITLPCEDLDKHLFIRAGSRAPLALIFFFSRPLFRHPSQIQIGGIQIAPSPVKVSGDGASGRV